MKRNVVSAVTLLVASLAALTGVSWASEWNDVVCNEPLDAIQQEGCRLLLAKGDFNGDAIPDVATIKTNKATGKLAIVVKISGEISPVVLDLGWTQEDLGYWSIKTSPPETFVTVCGKGTLDCEPNEPTHVHAKNDSLRVVKIGSGALRFVWKSNHFVKYFTSD